MCSDMIYIQNNYEWFVNNSKISVYFLPNIVKPIQPMRCPVLCTYIFLIALGPLINVQFIIEMISSK